MTRNDQQPKAAGQCGPCSPSLRNRYFRGKLLTVADYQAEQLYMIQRRRILNRAMLGWGVVSGFQLRLEGRVVGVGAGVALDRCGRELVACETVQLASAHEVLWLHRGQCGLEPAGPPQDAAATQQQQHQGKGPVEQREAQGALYLLAAHYAECRINGVRVDEGCGESVCEANHVCETVVYSLRPIDDCPSGLPACRPNAWPYQDCVGELDGRAAPLPTSGPLLSAVHDRGTHEQLCDWSTDWLGGFDPCQRLKLCRYGDFELDPDAGVPLACVRIGFDCGEAYIAEIVDACGPRRLARPNELLFDLVRGCDLVRIQDVGWRDWLDVPCKEVPFTDFAAMFLEPETTPDGGKAGRRKGRARSPADTRLWVCFSGPVQISSLTPDVITITLVQRDLNEDVGNVVRVPVPALAVAGTTPGDPAGTTRSFRPMVSARFWEGEINPDNSSGFETVTLVEIEIRTAFIIDRFGQEVAGGGRFVAGRAGTPGGRFLSSFTVVPDDHPPADQQTQPAEPYAQEV
jgi:hypothetical protein